MSDWGQGYVTEIPYTYGYYNELLPSSIDFALGSKGFRPPSQGKQDLRYLELGCGHGLTANIIAALNPGMSVTAVDFHPGHIAEAQGLAREAKLTNMRFVEADFAEFDASLDPDVRFDYITAHGVLSWISPEIRRAIVDLVAKRLAPGGALLVSYNALPGSSSRAIFHQIFSKLGGSPGEGAAARVNSGFRLLDEMSAAKARALAPLEGKIRGLTDTKSSGSYIAHEYLNEHSQPLFCSQVFDMFRTAKLSFCASADLLMHVDILHLDDPQRRMLGRWADAEKRELASDIIRDNGFRKDIFVRGPLPMSPLEHRAFWREQRFELSRPTEGIQLELITTRGQVRLPEDLYGPVLAHFEKGPSTASEALQEPTLSGKPLNEIIDVLRVYTGMGILSPVEDRPASAGGAAARFNSAVLARAETSDLIRCLAAPAPQKGVDCSWFEQLILRAEEIGSGSPAAFAWNVLKLHGRKFISDGRELSSDAENLAFAEKAYGDFAGGKKHALARFGIVRSTRAGEAV